MLTNNQYREKYFWWLLIATAGVLFIRLGAAPIYILDEAKNAQCASEMLQRQDWIVPTFNSELRTDKPPLHYFFMMLSYTVFGTTAFAARFFSAIAGIGTLWVTYVYTKKFQSSWVAFYSVLALALSTHFVFEFRLSVPDPYLIFFITLGLFSAFTWLQQKKIIQLYIAAFALAMATLAKGPIALALPGLCIILWVVWQRKWAVFFTWHLIPASTLFFAITAPWYIAVAHATQGEWLTGFFINHNINRFASPQEGHKGFFLLPVLFVALGLLPFTAFIGEMVKNKNLFKNDLARFCLIVTLVFVVFFSIASTRLPNYPMPCYPFIVVLPGIFIAALLQGKAHSKNYPYYILLVFTSVVIVAGYIALANEHAISEIKWLSFLLVIVPVILLIFIWPRKNKNWLYKIQAISIAYMVLNIIGLQIIYPELYRRNPVTQTKQIIKNNRPIIAYKHYNAAFNFNLHTNNIKKYQSIDSLKLALQLQPDAFIISRKKYLDSLKMLPVRVIAEHHDLFESPTTIILEHTP